MQGSKSAQQSVPNGAKQKDGENPSNEPPFAQPIWSTICSHTKISLNPTHTHTHTGRDTREARNQSRRRPCTHRCHTRTHARPQHTQPCHRARCWPSHKRKQPGLEVCVGGRRCTNRLALHRRAAHNPLQDPTAAPLGRHSSARHVPRHAAVETRGVVVYSHKNTTTHTMRHSLLYGRTPMARSHPPRSVRTAPHTHTHTCPQSAMRHHETPSQGAPQSRQSCPSHTHRASEAPLISYIKLARDKLSPPHPTMTHTRACLDKQSPANRANHTHTR